MRIQKRSVSIQARTAVLAAMLVAALTTGRAAELMRADLEARVVGNTIHYHSATEDVFEFLAPHGVLRGQSSTRGTYTARWRLDGDAICFDHDDPMASGCVGVSLREGFIEFHRRDDVVEGPFPFLKGNPRNL